MDFYYFNDHVDVHGNHEVHTGDCKYLPSSSNRTLIGYYSSCADAIAVALVEHPNYSFDGCFYCCRECHTG